MGYHITRAFVGKAMRVTDSVAAALTSRGLAAHQCHSVPGPNSLWHIDKHACCITMHINFSYSWMINMGTKHKQLHRLCMPWLAREIHKQMFGESLFCVQSQKYPRLSHAALNVSYTASFSWFYSFTTIHRASVKLLWRQKEWSGRGLERVAAPFVSRMCNIGIYCLCVYTSQENGHTCWNRSFSRMIVYMKCSNNNNKSSTVYGFF